MANHLDEPGAGNRAWTTASFASGLVFDYVRIIPALTVTCVTSADVLEQKLLFCAFAVRKPRLAKTCCARSCIVVALDAPHT
jgi:hypothetical protein